MPMIDSFGRTIDYLRVSVTDRCNFRCVYCMPEEGAAVAPREEILTYEEVERLVRVAARLGVRKVRLTGGEPLVRKDILTLVEKVAAVPGVEDLSLTTNGFLLSRHAHDLAAGGLGRVNISLDTLRADRFAAIARRGSLDEVLAGLDAALHAGLAPIKLNTVVMRGTNDDEVADFARLSVASPFHVRFIELMPINWSGGADEMAPLFSLALPRAGNVALYANEEAATFRRLFHPTTQCQVGGMLGGAEMRRMFVSAADIRGRVEDALGPLEPAHVATNGPARTYRLPGGVGTVGFISQVTNDHCAGCNRLRLTADGFLRPCLMAEGEVDLRTPLRAGASDEEIARLFLLTVHHKPKEHRLEDGVAPTGRGMSQLGG